MDWKESAVYWESEFERLASALRDAPQLPSARALCLLPHSITRPGDQERGKKMQRMYGLAVVPPVAEAEAAAGAWSRITGGTYTVEAGQTEMSVSEIMSRHNESES